MCKIWESEFILEPNFGERPQNWEQTQNYFLTPINRPCNFTKMFLRSIYNFEILALSFVTPPPPLPLTPLKSQLGNFMKRILTIS